MLPVSSDPIVNTSTTPGLEITGIMVENNVDPATKKDLSDRLQMTLVNTSSATLSDLEAFYTMTDSTTNKSESYYQKLTGLTIDPGASQTIYFDTETGPGHYPENVYSLYRTSPNEVVIDAKVSASGFAPATSQVAKAVGTGEKRRRPRIRLHPNRLLSVDGGALSFSAPFTLASRGFHPGLLLWLCKVSHTKEKTPWTRQRSA